MYDVTACKEYVSKCKWYIYMYVNKLVEIAQQGIALQENYVLFYLF